MTMEVDRFHLEQGYAGFLQIQNFSKKHTLSFHSLSENSEQSSSFLPLGSPGDQYFLKMKIPK